MCSMPSSATNRASGSRTCSDRQKRPGSARQLQHAHGPHAIRYHPRGAVQFPLFQGTDRSPLVLAGKADGSCRSPPSDGGLRLGNVGRWPSSSRRNPLRETPLELRRRVRRPPRHGAHNSRRPGQFRAETPAGKRPGAAAWSTNTTRRSRRPALSGRHSSTSMANRDAKSC